MTFKTVDPSDYSALAYPMITPIITAGGEEADNAMAATWTTPLSVKPPLYGVSIGKEKYTHQLIEEHNEFGVCFLDFDDVEKVLKVGRVSGRKVNKFEKFNLERKEANKIAAPLIKGSTSALECKVEESLKVGSSTFYVGKVAAAWMKQEILKGNVVDLKKIKPVLYLGYNTFSTTQEWDKEIPSR